MSIEKYLQEKLNNKPIVNEALELINQHHVMAYKTLADQVSVFLSSVEEIFTRADDLLPENISAGVKKEIESTIKTGMTSKGFNRDRAQAYWNKVVNNRINTMEDIIAINPSLERYKNS
jgi:hypothetical protein